MPTKLASNVKGIRGAMEVYGRLLEAGLEVYVPVMYIRHDAVVKTQGGQHIDVEIKSRAPGKSGFVVGRNLRPRPDLFFVLHYEGTDESWILPSSVARSRIAGSGDRIILGERMKEILHPYKNAYYLIAGPKATPGEGPRWPARKLLGKHFKQSDYAKEVIRILSEAPKPMRTKEIVLKVKETMGASFSKEDLGSLSRGRPRWDVYVRQAIYRRLYPNRLIEAKVKNQWTITEKGSEWLSKNMGT